MSQATRINPNSPDGAQVIIQRLNRLEEAVNKAQQFMTAEALVDYRRLLDRLARSYGLVYDGQH